MKAMMVCKSVKSVKLAGHISLSASFAGFAPAAAIAPISGQWCIK